MARNIDAEATRALYEIQEWMEEVEADQGIAQHDSYIDLTRNWIREHAHHDEPLAREICRRQGIDFRKD